VRELAARHKLSLKEIPLAAIEDDLELSKQFVAFEHDLRAALQLVEDTGSQADAEAWDAFLAYSGVLSSMRSAMRRWPRSSRRWWSSWRSGRGRRRDRRRRRGENDAAPRFSARLTPA
jgi:hypothetical protein